MEAFLHRALILSALACGYLDAETGRDAWLRYAPVSGAVIPAVVATTSDTVLMQSARDEVIRGLRGKTGKTLRAESGVPKENAIVLSTLDRLPAQWGLHATLVNDGYWLKTVQTGGVRYTVVTASNDRGVLYGAFALLRKESLGDLDEQQAPATAVRW